MTHGSDPIEDLARVVARLAAAGIPHAHAAALTLVTRRQLGLSSEAFARLSGVEPALVAAAEDGLIPLGDVMPFLSAVGPFQPLDLQRLTELAEGDEPRRLTRT